MDVEEKDEREVTAARAIVRALRDGRPLSLVRLGDGEALTLSQGTLLPFAEVKRRGPFLSYAGVEVPDVVCRDRLAAAIRRADVVGCTTSPGENFAPLLQSALQAHGIDLGDKIVTDAVVNYQLNGSGHLHALLLQEPRPRVLLVGNRAAELRPVLQRAGVRIVADVTPVRGCRDIDHVLAVMAQHAYDIALVSAGVSAVPICVEAAQRSGGVHLDFGHLADELITGGATLRAGKQT